MTMTDRGNVIRGLEMSYIYSNVDEDNTLVPQQLVLDALALLKAQEPRVMTLEEVAEGKPYWLDMRGIASEYAICKMNDCGDSAFLDFAVQYGNKTLESNGYGNTWRCWTSRPTDEQREAEPWRS